MNVLFLTLLDFKSLSESNIYTDLLQEFVKHSHQIHVISPVERKKKSQTYIIEKDNTKILKLRIGNIQKTNIIEKGLSTLLIERQFINGIKSFFNDKKFDLILYSTPPITFEKVVKYVKERDNAQTYLLLKDIFPQNAVDMGMLSNKGIRGLVYNFFRKKEKKLYALSDYIGCMSQTNVDYILKHNPELINSKVDVCPNCVTPKDLSVSSQAKIHIRQKYGIPIDKKIFIYGGNLGVPQGIPFLCKCLYEQKNNEAVFFVVVGSGTEFEKIENFIKEKKCENVKLIKKLPKEEYESMVGSCDIGMIFLDYRFTIPNFPSRILSYMQAQIPVFAVTDSNTDMGQIILEGQFGWWCHSNDIDGYNQTIKEILVSDIEEKGRNGMKYLLENYTAEQAYAKVMSKVENS